MQNSSAQKIVNMQKSRSGPGPTPRPAIMAISGGQSAPLCARKRAAKWPESAEAAQTPVRPIVRNAVMPRTLQATSLCAVRRAKGGGGVGSVYSLGGCDSAPAGGGRVCPGSEASRRTPAHASAWLCSAARAEELQQRRRAALVSKHWAIGQPAAPHAPHAPPHAVTPAGGGSHRQQ